jgi:uncharacterized protein (TIGR03086 family)
MSDVVDSHRTACHGFTAVVAQGEGSWTNLSPCPDWDARGVVEHVIGFHGELLLRPTGTEPECSTGEPGARWAATVSAIQSAIAMASSRDLDDPSVPSAVDLDRLLPALTAEVLVHTWDLAKAIGVEPRLDAELCEVAYDFMRANEQQVRSSGMFDSAVPALDTPDSATRLIAFLGRDAGWTPSVRFANGRSVATD